MAGGGGWASASAGLTWGPPVQVAGSLQGVSCPSVSLCLAADQAGNVVSATISGGRLARWKIVHVDFRAVDSYGNPARLSGISCPSVSLCVAVDNAGNVVVSTEPAGPPSAWSALHVDGANTLSAISCPSVSLCVAVDSGQNAVTSTNPVGGASAWTVAHIDNAVGPECGKYGPGQDCELGLPGVACPSTTLCVAVDRVGNAVTSTDPAGGPSTWTVANIERNSYTFAGAYSLMGVSCPTSSLCVAVDGYGQDVVTSRSPTGGQSAWSVSNIGVSLASVSCPLALLCFGVPVEPLTTNALVSRNPTGGAAAWRRTTIDQTAAVVDASCPSTSLCAAVDDTGHILVATRTPTRTQIRRLLLQALGPLPTTATIGALLKRGSYEFSFRAPSAGKLAESWYLVSADTHPVDSNPAPRAVAIGTATSAGPGKLRIKVKVTRHGKLALGFANHVEIKAKGSFTPAGGRTVIETKTFRINR